MTVVYDMVSGHLIWVETGRTAETFSSFLKQLPKSTAANIEAVAMDMGLAYSIVGKRVITSCRHCF